MVVADGSSKQLLTPLVTELGKHRLHDHLRQLRVLTSALSLAVHHAEGTPVNWKPDTSLGISLNAVDIKIHFPLVGPIEAAIKNLDVSRIEMAVEKIPPRGADAGSHPDMVQIFGLAGPLIFIDFFERHRPWVEENIGKINDWPPTYAFCRVIRHSLAHGGCLHMIDRKARLVSWRGITYTRDDHGKRAYGAGCDLWLGDLVLLMFDASEELDAAKCPLTP